MLIMDPIAIPSIFFSSYLLPKFDIPKHLPIGPHPNPTHINTLSVHIKDARNANIKISKWNI